MWSQCRWVSRIASIAVEVRVALQRGQRPEPEVDQQPEALSLHEVGRTGRLGAGETAGTAENGQSHAGPSGSRWVAPLMTVDPPLDRPLAETPDQSITLRSVRPDQRASVNV